MGEMAEVEADKIRVLVRVSSDAGAARANRRQIVPKVGGNLRNTEPSSVCRRFADDLLNTEPHGMKLNIFDTNR